MTEDCAYLAADSF